MYKIPDNSCVCFVGDSITAVFNYESIIANFYIENRRESKIKVYNCGAAGGSVWYQLQFIKDDTLIHKPTHAVIALGVNDSKRWAFDDPDVNARYKVLTTAYENYKINLTKLCEEFDKKGVQVILCTPPPYAEYQQTSQPAYKGGYALMLGYAEFCRQLAKEKGYPLCDYHKYLTEKMQTEALYVDDHVHLNDKGHFYMAKCFLELQGYELTEKKPLPPKFDQLIEACGVLRRIYAAEVMIIYDYSLSVEEKIAKIQKYLDDGKAKDDYFRLLCNNYLENRRKMDEYQRLVEELTDELMG